MRSFNSPPQTKALHPIFQLGMIAGYDDKQDKKAGEKDIPKLVSLLLKERDARDGPDQEDRQAPSGKSRAGPTGAIQQTVEVRRHAKEGILSVQGSVWRGQGHSCM